MLKILILVSLPEHIFLYVCYLTNTTGASYCTIKCVALVLDRSLCKCYLSEMAQLYYIMLQYCFFDTKSRDV